MVEHLLKVKLTCMRKKGTRLGCFIIFNEGKLNNDVIVSSGQGQGVL